MLDTPGTTPKSHADGKILQHADDGVGIVTFNNPEKRNAMSLEMWEGLGKALTELRDDPAVRVVILVGAGDKAFVSGADISQFEQTRHNAEASAEYSKRSEAQRALLANYPKPTIACIRRSVTVRCRRDAFARAWRTPSGCSWPQAVWARSWGRH